MAICFPMAKFDPNTDLTYTGSKTVIDDGNDNWRVKFLTSGTLTFLKDPKGIDLFIAGGGGGGAQAGGGGGGGYTGLWSGLSVALNTGYPVVIGAGGALSAGVGNPGSASSVFGHSASGGGGGHRGTDTAERSGGSGGSGGGGYNNGTAGADGSNGGNGYYAPGGSGQGSTTREFHESGMTLYSTGGASGPDLEGAANTGEGGDGFGYNNNGMAGGSGIVVIRNAA
jgi:hypothetical protein